ncbi:MAG: ribosome biogenesis factor YjgA [Desulfuromonadales bacterium]|nr:ribosome biogenesis factor YjgA [Desulfuromonadales bacterium]
MDDREPLQEGRGRSAKKRAAQAVEELAFDLVELPESELGKLPLSDDLRRELALARATRGQGSRRRQIKHFAGCLRRDEVQRLAIEQQLASYRQALARQTHDFHRLEELRDQLCAEQTSAAALTEIGRLWPTVDLRKLASLARAARLTADKKAAREIFRRLRQAAEGD